MNVIACLTIACLTSAVAIAMSLEGPEARAVVAGMAGPLVSACVTWAMIDRAVGTDPAGLTRRLLAAFLVKAVLFLAYVFVAVKIVGLPAKPFAMSFTAYFIVLHQIEAVLLRRRAIRAPQLS